MSYTSVIKQSGSIPSTDQNEIQYDLYYPSVSVPETFPILLFLHGLKGFKDWGPIPDACEDLSRAGFAVLAFNASHSGVTSPSGEIDREDLFKTMTISQDIADVGSVIKALKEGDITTNRIILDAEKLGIIGHSRGGHHAIVSSAEFPEIQALVSWSAVADFTELWDESMISSWQKGKDVEIENARTGQKLKVGPDGYQDLIDKPRRLTAMNRVKELHLPSLFIAGKQDETVPISHTERLFRACPSDQKELRLIPDTGHTFGAEHPFTDSDYPPHFSEVIEYTESWFLEHLR